MGEMKLYPLLTKYHSREMEMSIGEMHILVRQNISVGEMYYVVQRVPR